MFLMACPLSEDRQICGGIEELKKYILNFFFLKSTAARAPRMTGCKLNHFHAVMLVWKILQKMAWD
jgi:hypothetical protein